MMKWVFYGLFWFYIIFFSFVFFGCAHVPKIVTVECPPPPTMRQVEVVAGSVSGENLKNVVDNHIDLWEYIHKIQALGCRTNK